MLKSRWLTFGLLAIGLALLPFLVDAGMGRSWVRLLDLALLYVMLALGLNIVVGYAGLLDLGYVAFYALGASVLRLARQPALRLAPAGRRGSWPRWAASASVLGCRSSRPRACGTSGRTTRITAFTP